MAGAVKTIMARDVPLCQCRSSVWKPDPGNRVERATMPAVDCFDELAEGGSGFICMR